MSTWFARLVRRLAHRWAIEDFVRAGYLAREERRVWKGYRG